MDIKSNSVRYLNNLIYVVYILFNYEIVEIYTYLNLFVQILILIEQKLLKHRTKFHTIYSSDVFFVSHPKLIT